jgi:poly-gamma-glutamate synthesis protein (capsule biosynthesis protein)
MHNTVTAMSSFTIGITGDVNLNPEIAKHNDTPFEYVWGDLVEITKAVDVMAIQHEGTLAEERDPNPATIQFEDPLNYEETYAAAGIDYITIANNHQFDYGWSGLSRTNTTLLRTKIPFGGVGMTAAAVRRPIVLEPGDNINTNTISPVAFFNVVIDECWKNENGTLYLDGCTCGDSANPLKDPPYQCYAAIGNNPANTTVRPGLWYHFGITNEFTEDIASTVEKYKQSHPAEFVVVYLHVGPNFQWDPYPEHEQLLRTIAMRGADLVWGTSSHHIQRFEVVGKTPIVYGLGDFLFRHIVGVEDWCPIYARPCEAYRPELSLFYIFNVKLDDQQEPHIDLENITAIGTKHDHNRTAVARTTQDISWIIKAFERQSPNASLLPSSQAGHYQVVVKT